jgi:hypothetical protein
VPFLLSVIALQRLFYETLSGKAGHPGLDSETWVSTEPLPPSHQRHPLRIPPHNRLPFQVQIAHFAVGAAKSLITVRSWWSSGFEMTLVGVLEGAVTYGIGILLGKGGM